MVGDRETGGLRGKVLGKQVCFLSFSIVLLPKEFSFHENEKRKRKRKRVSFCLPHPSFETSQDLQEREERLTGASSARRTGIFFSLLVMTRGRSQDESLSSLKRSSWSRRVCPSLTSHQNSECPSLSLSFRDLIFLRLHVNPVRWGKFLI